MTDDMHGFLVGSWSVVRTLSTTKPFSYTQAGENLLTEKVVRERR